MRSQRCVHCSEQAVVHRCTLCLCSTMPMYKTQHINNIVQGAQ